MFPKFSYLIGTEICGLVLAGVIIIFYLMQRKLNIKNELYFIRTIILAMFTCAFDIVSIILNTSYPDALITEIFAKAYLIMILFSMVSVLLYIAGDTVSRHRYKVIANVASAICTVISVAVAFTDIEVADVYTSGTATVIEYAAAVSIIFFILGFTFVNRKIMVRDKAPVIFIWMISWFTLAFIQFLFPKILLVSFGLTFGIVVSYVKIEALDNLIDSDTGLFNWNSYLKYVNNIKLQNKTCAIILLKPDNSLSDLDEDLYKDVLDRFNEAIKRSKDFIAFTYKNEYILVLNDVEKIDDVRSFLRERKYADYIVGTKFKPYVIENVEMIENQDDIDALVSYIESKKIGVDQNILFIDNEMIKSFFDKGLIAKELQQAMDNDRILVYYQPIYSVVDNKFTSAEALVRMVNSEGKILPPGVFIPVAESNGLIGKLDKIVFDKVCEFISLTDMDSLGLHYIEINLSGAQLTDERLADEYIAIAKKYNVDPKYINLEITESTDIEFRKNFENNLDKFMKNGFKFSLDDYGTGYSNLNYVLGLPISIVKFDKQMTDKSFVDNKAKYVMDYSIKMFRSLKYKIVIEGVETKEQLEELKKLGVEYIQGYYFSKPIDSASFCDFIQNNNCNLVA